jgi:hypothetical protein
MNSPESAYTYLFISICNCRGVGNVAACHSLLICNIGRYYAGPDNQQNKRPGRTPCSRQTHCCFMSRRNILDHLDSALQVYSPQIDKTQDLGNLTYQLQRPMNMFSQLMSHNGPEASERRIANSVNRSLALTVGGQSENMAC